MAPFGQKAHPVPGSGVPLGGELPALIPVPGGCEGHGRRQGVGPPEPGGGVRHGLHPDQPLIRQRPEHLQLGPQAGPDILPEEIVLLSHLGVSHAQAFLPAKAVEEPTNPLRVPACEPGGLQGVHPLQALPQILLKIVNGVRAQKPENRRGQLLLPGLSGDKFILPAGIVDAVGVAAPEGEAVGPQLVPANGAAQKPVLLRPIAQGHRVQNPSADGLGVPAEHLVKIRHIRVQEPLSLLRFVADTIGAVHPVVVHRGDLPPEGHARPAAQGLGDLPPDGKLVALVQVIPKQGLVPGIHQGVVLQSIGPGKAVLLDQGNLLLNRLKIVPDKPAGLDMRHADKLINMDHNRLSHPVFFLLCSVPAGAPRAQGSTRAAARLSAR